MPASKIEQAQGVAHEALDRVTELELLVDRLRHRIEALEFDASM